MMVSREKEEEGWKTGPVYKSFLPSTRVRWVGNRQKGGVRKERKNIRKQAKAL